jgi:hypothetical protein
MTGAIRNRDAMPLMPVLAILRSNSAAILDKIVKHWTINDLQGKRDVERRHDAHKERSLPMT